MRKRKPWIAALMLSWSFVTVAEIPGPPAAPATFAATMPDPGIVAELVVSGLAHPVYLTAPTGDPRLFVVLQAGQIVIIKDGQLLATPFLDISSLTVDNNEQGLLGLAFAPDYNATGLFYINYTDLSGNTVIARYQVSASPDVADVGSGETVLAVTQPGPNHNGSQIAFGPDGYLYIGMGDGGGYAGTGDKENAQKDDTLLGKMLRIDVSGGMGSTYSVPIDNPFVGGTPLDEIWARGFRNPYRWSFDRGTGDIYVADVGQQTWEEVSVEPASDMGGGNYGWPRMEGFVCHLPPTACNDGSLTLPVHAYEHLDGPCAIVGGYVYRGEIESIRGHYFFGDWCTGQVWSFAWNEAESVTQLRDRSLELTPKSGAITRVGGFGEDGFGEIYIIDRAGGGGPGLGEVFRIVVREHEVFRGEAP